MLIERLGFQFLLVGVGMLKWPFQDPVLVRKELSRSTRLGKGREDKDGKGGVYLSLPTRCQAGP